MPELRWILLLLGVLFLAALAWWEIRRPRQANRREPEAPAGEPERTVTREHGSHARHAREPVLTLPEIHVREPAHELRAAEVPDDSLIGLRLDGERIEDDVAAPAPDAAEPPEPIVPAPPEAAAPAVIVRSFEVPQPAELVVDWPEDGTGRIVALRLAAPPDRFSGRALRQALTAEGFLLGKFDIFHKPGPDQRVVVSAAGLTKPGTFDLETMDTQRYVGLNLFTVLPGPLAPEEAFDELLGTARNLNDRLTGALQDERGGPLTSARIAAIRETLESERGPAAPATGSAS